MPQSAEARKLRQELKEWERAFAETHDGRKPTRDEIKKDANIAAKYTEYYKLTEPPKPKPTSKPSSESLRKPSTSSARSPLQDDPDNPFASSASKSRPPSSRSKRPSTDDIFKTPSKPYTNDLYDSPLSTRGRRLFGNRATPRETVGPTPQKTGKVLGIFETFIDVETTPTHNRVLGSTPTSGNGRVSASPADAFTTPRKRKAAELAAGETPSKRVDAFATPSFLRRDSARVFMESPPVPQPIRPPVRGLSSMVAELRKMEDDAHEDEEEAMREMEAGGAETQKKGAENDPDTGLLPLPEGAWAEDQLEEESSGEEEKEKKPKWKKKGLKRQHRRVIMRPVGKVAHVSDAEEPPNPEEAELPAAGYEDEDFSDLDEEPELPEDPKAAKRAKTDTGVVEKGKAVVKKVARKISAKAHANYKRLNIRGSKGAKAGNGRGRFSRKRR